MTAQSDKQAKEAVLPGAPPVPEMPGRRLQRIRALLAGSLIVRGGRTPGSTSRGTRIEPESRPGGEQAGEAGMSYADDPAAATPAFLAGLTCDGLQRSPPSSKDNADAVNAFLPEEMGSFEKETGPQAHLYDGLTSSAGEEAESHPADCSPKEMLKGLGWAVAVHAGLLLAVLLFPMNTSFHAAESRFITVSFVGSGDGSGGDAARPGGASEGKGGSMAAPSCPSVPAPDRAARLLQIEEVPEAPRPAEPEPIKMVSLPPERPVVKERPPLRSTPAPVKKKCPVSSPKPEKRKTPDARTDRAVSPPLNPSDFPSAGDEAKGAAPEGSSGNGPGLGEGDGRSIGGGKGSGPGKGGFGGGAGGTAGEFTVGQVDNPPVVLHKVHPHFPEVARRMGISGKIVVKFLVKPDGHVSRPSILEVRPSGLFEEPVLAALSQWEFKPGTYKGRAVPTWVVQTIHFKLTR